MIPVKDDDTELERCLRALASQTRAADEIIVVDNGSLDASAAVARANGARVVSCRVPGIPAASACGYDAATGDVILRLDADCVPESSWIATMACAFDARPDVSALVGGAHFIDGPRILRLPLAVLYLGAYAVVATPTLGHLPLFGSNMGFRRSAWRGIRAGVHRSDPELHDDLDLAFHLGRRHRIRYLPRARMGISMRPFASGRSFARRVRRGFRTVVIHWPQDFPPLRWVRPAVERMRPPVSPAGRAARRTRRRVRAGGERATGPSARFPE
ncbi:glycosyltransferase [Microbacterium timonense]|uniref:glycosyltransferase n=1 Tax=Microbacterium timonense TaxID=2086576 RepID=UPI001F23C4DD|nr:glycosyltransferase family 2 protein [Microbacterium timonense]